MPHTVEEAYELADAAASGDDAKLLDELGDVLFQVHFLALLLEERDAGDLAAVAANATEKLIRRHPHVFGDAEATDAGQVLSNWDGIKRDEEGRAGAGPFADVPENLPGLLYARKLQRRALSAGLDGPSRAIEEALERLDATARELAAGPLAEPAEVPSATERDQVEREIGELLLAAVDVARIARVDPELALRGRAEALRAAAEAG